MFRCRVFCRSRIQTGTERGTQWAERARSRLTMCRKGKESSQGGSSVLCRKYRTANGGELVNVHCQRVRLNCVSVKHDQCYTKHIDEVYVHLLRNHFVGKWQYIMQSAVQKYGDVYISVMKMTTVTVSSTSLSRLLSLSVWANHCVLVRFCFLQQGKVYCWFQKSDQASTDGNSISDSLLFGVFFIYLFISRYLVLSVSVCHWGQDKLCSVFESAISKRGRHNETYMQIR